MHSLSDEAERAIRAQTRAAQATPFRDSHTPSVSPHHNWQQFPGWFTTGDAAALRGLLGRLPEGGTTAHIGVFAGRHLAACADVLLARRLSVVGVDTFAGSRRSGEANDWDLCRCFCAAALQHHLGDRGIPVRLYQADSRRAALGLALLGERFDLVFIDADHEPEELAQDVHAWQPLLRNPQSILCGHDHGVPEWPGVERVVTALLPSAEVIPDSSVWWYGGAR